jgi:class 3 adenylate cyclase
MAAMSVDSVRPTDRPSAASVGAAVRLSGERKPITAVFADVVGSTTLAERLDPEDWTEVLNEAYDLISRAVQRYEGTTAQLQGDGVLALFGAPVAHEDDPERAVRAALDMVAAIDAIAPKLKAAHDIDFRIRAGVNTGPAIVGTVGSDLRTEYTALGDAVNIAARVESAAEAGQVLVTEMTRRYIEPVFALDDLGEVALKGKSEPLHLYRVVGTLATPGERRGLRAVGLSSPLVGRSAELEALASLYGVVRAGRGRVAVIAGEPGIGKSRLLAELRTAISSDGLQRWVEGRCVSYGRSLPYHLVLDIVRSLLGIPVGAGETEMRAQLDARLPELLGDEATDIGPYLAHLLALSLRPEEADRVQFEPERIQSRYVASVHRVLRALCAQGPVVLVCEDIHWADPASIDTLLALLPIVTPLPVLVLLACRAETDAPGWRLVDHARATYGEALTELRLAPLDDSHSRTLVANLLEIESLPDTVRDAILTHAEGNPFFVEEVIRMLIERGAIVASDERWVAHESISDIAIPDTLHGLLLARIDALPEAAKRSLRVAAVIGRQFPVRVLEKVLTDG